MRLCLLALTVSQPRLAKASFHVPAVGVASANQQRPAGRPTQLRVQASADREKLERSFTMPATMGEGEKNVLGTKLEVCSLAPKTGFYRDGYCCTGPSDTGRHVVCCRVTKEFLDFSRSRGNDLITPAPQYSFPGLQPGDRWCLCASRWTEALDAGVAPPVILEATAEAALKYAKLEDLKAHAVDTQAK